MANKLGTNPMTLDTAGATSLFPTPVHVSSLAWVNPTTIGHQLIINDKNGNLIVKLTCTVANQAVNVDVLDAWWNNGFQIAQIDSGIAVIFM